MSTFVVIKQYKQQIRASLNTSFIVGTVLILINHGSSILAAEYTFSDLLHWSMNYFVPFSVSLYSRLAAINKTNKGSPDKLV
jgi:hypothetical protein